MCKWYYLCTYSFDPDVTVVGPFDSERECLEAANRDAKKEFDDSFKNGIHCCMNSDYQTLKITLEEDTSENDVTTWSIFSISIDEPQYVLKRNIRTSRVPLYISLDECVDTACLAAAKRFDFEAASAEQERIFKEYGDFYKIVEVVENENHDTATITNP